MRYTRATKPTEVTGAARRLIEEVRYVVEATSTEQFLLWSDLAKQSRRNKDSGHGVDWQEIREGYLYTIGYLPGRTILAEKRPINVHLSFARIEGSMVMFYTSQSQVVDWLMVESWVKGLFPKLDWPQDKWRRSCHCDAMNFHQCLAYVTGHY